jgi:hypothetical protein
MPQTPKKRRESKFHYSLFILFNDREMSESQEGERERDVRIA